MFGLMAPTAVSLKVNGLYLDVGFPPKSMALGGFCDTFGIVSQIQGYHSILQ